MSTSKHDEERLFAGLQLDERSGPARRISRDQAAQMVDQALATWALETSAAPARRTYVWQAAAAAVALLTMIGGASAARWYFGKADRVETSAPTRAPRSVARRAQVLAPLTVEADPEPSAEAAPEARVQPPKHEPARAKAEPEDLLQRANQLRAAGRFQSATDTYAQVYERYPHSLSAYAAQIAAASIELEHLGKPQHARKLFEAALRSQPRGALDLEARQGLALSLRDLGRDKDEAEALRALIRAHAETPAARRAEARLKELTDAAP